MSARKFLNANNFILKETVFTERHVHVTAAIVSATTVAVAVTANVIVLHVKTKPIRIIIKPCVKSVINFNKRIVSERSNRKNANIFTQTDFHFDVLSLINFAENVWNVDLVCNQ